MIKLIAFDWNGTIISDNEAVIIAENAARKAFGLRLTNFPEFQNEFEIPISKYWINAGLDPELFIKSGDEIQRIFMENYEPLEKNAGLRNGATEILEWLRENNFKACIFSNHPQAHIVTQLEKFKLTDLLGEIIGRDVGDNSHLHKRSKEEKLAAYVESLSLLPTEVITVGDTTEEIEIGSKRGYHTVAITGGWQSTDRLKAAKPEYLINDLIELKDIIAKL